MNKQDKFDWMVYVSCMTFNHASYIEDAMNGFTMQETNFPFVCAIVDDASTDGEQEVIKNYMNEHFDLEEKKIVRQEETDDYVLIFARHKTNLNCFFAVFYLKYNHYSIKKSKVPYFAKWRENAKYIASCEGDDYWTTPNKLQMQFEVLEKNKDCSICFHRVQAVSSDKEQLLFKIPKAEWGEKKIELKDHIHEQFHHDFCFQTSSLFIRRDAKEEGERMREGIFKTFPVGDIPGIWSALLKARGYYIPEMCSCYRRFSGGYTSRVVANPSYAIALNKKFIAAFGEFDKYTDYHYHEELEYAIAKHELNIISIKREPLKILKKRYLAIFRDRGLKFTVLYLWSFFPFHFNMMAKLEKLKSNLTSKRN